MDDIKLEHERAAGDRLIDWSNQRDGSHFNFACRGEVAPDLVYADGERIVRVEVVGAYYDEEYARFLWTNAKQLPDAPKTWSGPNPDGALLWFIEDQVNKKCTKAYGPDCMLLVGVRPSLTSTKQMSEQLSKIQFPAEVPFVAIFVAGEMPESSRSGGGGYHVWQLYGGLA